MALGRPITPETDAATLVAAARERNALKAVHLRETSTLDRVDLWKDVFDTLVEPTLWQPTFITDFPDRAVPALQAEARGSAPGRPLRVVRVRT